MIWKKWGIEGKVRCGSGVQRYRRIEPLDAAEAENSSAPEVEASIVTIGDDGVSEAQDDIADALETAAKDKASNSISLFSRAAVQTEILMTSWWRLIRGMIIMTGERRRTD